MSGFVLLKVILAAIFPAIAGFVLSIPLAMRLGASLICRGLGEWHASPGWRQMINTGMNFMYSHWHMVVFPSAALAITVRATPPL